jgi:glycine betaine/proline transport system substrate-binding protein
MMQKILLSVTALLGTCCFAGSAAAKCGSVSVAEMNWGSAGIAAHIDKIILEKGYGCTVTLVPGDTLPTFTTMNETGEPDLAPEFWVNTDRAALDKAVTEGRLVVAAEILMDGAVEGWWIPKFVADAHPDIRTVQQALDHPDLFPAPGRPGRAAIHNCPSDWSCHVSTANLYRAVRAADKGFDLVDGTSPAAFDQSLVSAFATETGWLGYYWAPTAMLGKYEMVKLSFDVPHNRADWNSCTAVPNCPNPSVNSYPISQAFTLVTKPFLDKANVAIDYVKARKWDNATISSVLAWQADNGADNEAAARHFLQSMPDIWTKWVSPDVAGKVKASF